MQISALKEISTDENRVALTPDAIKLFQRLGLDVLIEDGAGNNSGYPNNLYEENGAKIVSRNECLQANICLCVKIPKEEDLNLVNETQLVDSEVIERLNASRKLRTFCEFFSQ